MSIRTRLTAWYAIVLTITIFAMGTFLVWRLRVDLVRGLDATLVTRAQDTLRAIDDPDHEGEAPDLGEVSGGRTGGLTQNHSVTQILSRRGALLGTAGGGVVRPLIEPATASSLRQPKRATVGSGGSDYRLLAVRLGRGSVLVVAEPLAPVDAAARRLLVLLAIALPGAVGLSIAGGYLLARRALLPIDRMTRAAAAISPNDLGVSLEVGELDDEVGRLGRTLNAMLERLHDAVAEQRRFTADASHELRTPLSIMQIEIDVALRAASTPKEARPVLESMSEEVVRLSAIVENLMTLARADEGRLDLNVAPVDVTELARAVIERLEAKAVRTGCTLALEASGPTIVSGDAVRLDQVLTNLVDNAIGHTRGGGAISVRVGGDSTEVRIDVRDEGDGIPPADIPHIFDRFYSADKARTRARGGAGLGLAICRTIVESHDGEISVTSVVGEGTDFVVKLPRRRLPVDRPSRLAAEPALPPARGE